MEGRSTWVIVLGAVAIAACSGSTEGGMDAGVDAPGLVCASDAQCDDGVFCNGPEVCAPGGPGTSVLGCRAGERPCTAAQMCDEDVGACVSICGLRTDADGDGVDARECGGDDCDDADASRFPGAEELCNDRDDDCDDTVDEGAACAADAGVDGGSDAGPPDGGRDASVPPIDAETDADASTPTGDAGPPDGGAAVATCEACATHADCQAGSYCVTLTLGGRACVPGCNPTSPTCPRGFACVLDVGTGVDTTICLPVGGGCCVDEDRDLAGSGIGCAAVDCDDTDETVRPGAPELCNARDDDCDGAVDEPPTPCTAGFCRPVGGGFELVTGGTCTAGACSGGSTTSCGGYRCEGDASGAMCGASCLVGGADDDARCAATYHCDTGACVADAPDGTACDEDSDCVAGHCNNGFCCSSGTCCAVAADCPGGAVALSCDSPSTCQGTRTESTCMDFQCRTSGTPDDSGCDGTTRALDCVFYHPRFCTGAVDQTPPSCPTSCSTDGDCIEGGHCELASCVPDRPPGAPCVRTENCQSGLLCVDGVCCTSACDGPCEACNLAGAAGACTAIPGGCTP